MTRGLFNRSGFTLVEVLIVVVILSVLAAIAIPQFTSSTEDAKLAALDVDLAELRNAIELYYHQHNSVYPGAINHTTGAAAASAAEAQAAFTAQLTLYTSSAGITANVKDATYKYGPYMKKVPENPYNELASILADITETDITIAASSGVAGWKFYTNTGRLVANDGAHDSN
jgi:prepilin-type N-terminal cleavage/methylation domain-containing protein